MGLIAESGAITMVGSVIAMVGPAPETSLVALGLSLPNRGFTFRRDRDAFQAEYRVEATFRQGGTVTRQIVRDERVRVASFRETQRSDESVVFQQFVPLPPGQYVLSLTIRDRNGPNLARTEHVFAVPRFDTVVVSAPVPVYESEPRGAAAATPAMVMNPRATVEYGADSMRFYVETIGLPQGDRLVVSVHDGLSRVLWEDTASLAAAAGPLRALSVAIPPSRLSMGRFELRVSFPGGRVARQAPFLVSFSDQWAVSNLEEMASLLRYFASADSLRAVLAASPEERGAAWQRFWRQTDPNPATPENEALDEYFARVQSANELYRDEGIPGWLTERGEVFVSLGEPDEVIDRRPDLQNRRQVLYWVYNEHRLTLVFVDDTGFGRFRLDPRSRSEFMRVLNRVRRGM
jgi:GWxTD domain-containing protein